MTTILQINSAARSQGANSTTLANETVAQLVSKNPGAQVVVRDLLTDGVPHLDEAVIGAFFTPEEQRSAEQKAIIARSDELIAEIQAADYVVFGVPLYNFQVPTQLKAYFDWIARARVTFRYREDGSVEGLIQGKKVIVAFARGGNYKDTPADSQTPYIKTILGFLGMTDVTFIYAEGLARGPESAATAFANAREAIAAL
ncbi:FMN-dependent NADH-azoreductase [Pandoraea horticolens]|uniref:FMN dependent NADH:quinone oxidoreductase n=1 Tax=Pandoraea horticolens TaxID=2508298 RepID=A0A5E4VZN1_9BURK|nr:NAD(P)H-dependent oxidoreductase [Pandoraea horticolens]VVE16345.1 FMN-dependent NADH-azoreductase [Pandoraea horticolens]